MFLLADLVAPFLPFIYRHVRSLTSASVLPSADFFIAATTDDAVLRCTRFFDVCFLLDSGTIASSSNAVGIRVANQKRDWRI